VTHYPKFPGRRTNQGWRPAPDWKKDLTL
jgi:hypothetical protein